ncbi:MAG TPA: flagellar motor switch phosphatase FliY [Negativicutes bacterium]|nr:flagellar motor switch phosphatase FliY [Negativicutes bacterium]
MSDSFLSQEEIDALLRSESSAAPAPAATANQLSDVEIDALGEVGNISMGSAATTMSVLLSRRVEITTPRVSIGVLDEMRKEYPMPYIIVEVRFTQGINGTNLLAMKESDAAIIADLMMGNDGSNPPEGMSELYMSAVAEAMNQMMGATATSLSSIFKSRVDLAPPKVRLIDLAGSDNITDSMVGGETLARIAFRMVVEGLIDSEIMLLLPLNVARDMVDGLLHSSAPAPAPAPAPTPQPSRPAAPAQAPMAAAPPMQQQSFAAPPPQQQRVMGDQNVMVQTAQFAPLKQSAGMNFADSNISMIMDVPLQVTVELGRTRKLIREILELAPGSVLELDKLAGEPVDILVNGKIVAKGEVVVIDENFGVRITGIVSLQERASTLQ